MRNKTRLREASSYWKDPSKFRQRNKAKYQKHKDKMLLQSKIAYSLKREEILLKKRREYPEKKDKVLSINREWRKNNSDKVKLADKAYKKKEYRNNPIFCLRIRVRARIANAIRKRGWSKKSKTQSIIGCSWDELKTHLEKQFQLGMNWENRSLWHIDHIIPLASASSLEEMEKLCFYTNLQPLWSRDNLKKGDKIIRPCISESL